MKFNYKWKFKDYPKKKNNLNVFSCFACGGGSSMGYKLAGYNVLGCLEIDKKIIGVYKKNHNPKYAFNCDIREFVKNKQSIPKELYNLDILDGSPPCSVFSLAGKREHEWNKEKKFKEGQKLQKLNDLFVWFIELGKILQPKVIIAENVKGLILGQAKGYVKEIFELFRMAGYETQLFLLNAATMGVPQKRERIFFIAKRKDLKFPKIQFNFKEKQIPFKDISDDNDTKEKISILYKKYWKETRQGDGIGKYKCIKKISYDNVCNTLLATNIFYHPKFKRKLNKKELIEISTFPIDYNFLTVNIRYLVGMSVPPVMAAQIANEVYCQWLKQKS